LEIPGGVWANQFDNVDNKRAHYETTAPEIAAQLPGRLSAFSCAIGTGGTLAGCAQYFRQYHPNVKIGLTDPCGANLHRFYKNGELKSEGSSITEGIGQGRVTANLAGFVPDSKEGLALGMSSGINAAGVQRLAKELGPGHSLVTILCDSASRYQAKMFNRDFLREKGLPESQWFQTNLPHDIAAAPGPGSGGARVK
jgi:cysteine synthase A